MNPGCDSQMTRKFQSNTLGNNSVVLVTKNIQKVGNISPLFTVKYFVQVFVKPYTCLKPVSLFTAECIKFIPNS